MHAQIVHSETPFPRGVAQSHETTRHCAIAALNSCVALVNSPLMRSMRRQVTDQWYGGTSVWMQSSPLHVALVDAGLSSSSMNPSAASSTRKSSNFSLVTRVDIKQQFFSHLEYLNTIPAAFCGFSVDADVGIGTLGQYSSWRWSHRCSRRIPVHSNVLGTVHVVPTKGTNCCIW